MSLQTRLSSLITAIGTDIKTLRTYISGTAGGNISALTTTDKTSLVAAINEVKAGAQPLDADLTTLASVTSGAFGRTLLTSAAVTDARTSLGLSAVAISGSAADLTGTLPSSALPPLAINETFVVVNQAAMLALTAQRGDMAIRTDNGKTYVLSTDSPTTLADWKEITASGSVSTVNGQSGTVVLTKSDVGLGNVDNTSDVNKPVSTAQAAANNLRLLASANLSDLASVITARSNLSVYSQAEMGDPETDLAALYVTAKS